MVTTLPVNTGPRRARSLVARVGLGALSLLVASVTAISLDATTLAVIRTHNQVIIAGDSLLVWYGGDRRSQLTCKLDVRDDVVFAMAGLVVSPENDFDVQQLMHLVLKTPGTLEERTVVLERLVQGRLLGTLTRIQMELPGLFAKQLASGFVLNVTLAAVRDGVAYLEMRDFYAEVAPDQSIRLRVNRVSCPRECPRPTEVFGVGETAAMMKYLGGLPELPDALPALAEQMVEMEIADRPALVGPPVDIVRAGESGIEWLHRKPACAG
jgi:hypothetical protein